MNAQIPIYRAKKIASDEYVEGYYTERVHHYPSGRHYIHFHNGSTATYETIDPTTIAIHFPDIIDSEGNKIFASLSENGKGGDIIEYNEGKEVIKYSIGTIQTYMFRFEDLIDLNIKVVGVHQWTQKNLTKR